MWGSGKSADLLGDLKGRDWIVKKYQCSRGRKIKV